MRGVRPASLPTLDLSKPPPGLVEAFKEDRAAVFVGAGASIAAGIPGWDEFVRTLARSLNGLTLPKGRLSSESLLKVPQYYIHSNAGAPRELVRRLTNAFDDGIKAFRKQKPRLARPVHHYLAQLPTTVFYTTNIDSLLEEELDDQRVEYELIDSESAALQGTERRRCQVRKIHGTLHKGEWKDLVLTRSDFASVPTTRPILIDTLENDLRSRSFLFVGYSLRDPDFNAIYNNVFQRMSGKHQRHYIALLEDPGEYELDDLDRQGLMPIRLWEYPGRTGTAKVCTFLRMLVRETSERTHIRSFYRGLERGDHVAVVIASRIHEEKGYAYYPAHDIHTSEQIADHLREIGATWNYVADVVAVKKKKELLRENVIIVCSPAGNKFARYVFDAASRKDCAIREAFVDDKVTGRRSIVTRGGKKFTADDPLCGSGKRVEYFLVARYANPWTPRKFIYVCAGCHALGTHAIGDFLTHGGYCLLTEDDTSDNIVAIVPVHYSDYNALAPKFDVGAPVFVSGQ